MSTFRHPKTHNERKANQELRELAVVDGPAVSARIRTGKSGTNLPTERNDMVPAARKDRARGNISYSKHRKAKENERVRHFD